MGRHSVFSEGMTDARTSDAAPLETPLKPAPKPSKRRAHKGEAHPKTGARGPTRGLARRTPLRRTGRLNPKSAKTGGHRFPQNVDEDFREYVRGLKCEIAPLRPNTCWGAVECAHVKSRGAGGADEANCLALCAGHHREQHQAGIRTFQRWYGLDLAAIARRTWDAYRDGGGA